VLRTTKTPAINPALTRIVRACAHLPLSTKRANGRLDAPHWKHCSAHPVNIIGSTTSPRLSNRSDVIAKLIDRNDDLRKTYNPLRS